MPSSWLYNPKDDYVKKSIPTISFGPRPPKPPKNAAKSDGPGPGSYTIPTTLDTSKGAVLLGRVETSKSKGRYDSPGPGAYAVTSDNPTFKSKKGVLLLGRPKDK